MYNIIFFSVGLFLLASLGFATELNHVKTVFGDQGFSKLTQQRHSGYSFDSTKSISSDLMLQLAKAAQLSPSSYNDQPWRFIFCDRQRTPEAYAKALSCLVEPNQEWAKDAPLLIVVIANTVSSYNQKTDYWAQYDTGAAAMSLAYQAASSGLMAHQMGGFDVNKTGKEFMIPSQMMPMTIIAVGYESEDESGKISPKERQPLGELFFLGELGNGLK
jgi:nitroreductase